MPFHGNILNSPAILLIAQSTMPVAIKWALVIGIAVFFLIVGYIILSGLRAGRAHRGMTRQQIIQEYKDKAAEKIRKAEEEWRLPPELEGPTPRTVRSAPLIIRLLLGFPLPLFLIALAAAIYSFGFFHTYRPPVEGWQQTSSFLVQNFLEFLRAPDWHGWMLLPTAVFVGVACFLGLPGRFRRRREKRLLRWGVPARALIASFTVEGAGEGAGGSLWRLEYHDAAGNLVKSSVARNTMPDRNKPIVTVLYNPQKPREFVFYPVSRFRVG